MEEPQEARAAPPPGSMPRTLPTVVAAQCSTKAASLSGNDLPAQLGLPALRLFPLVRVPNNHSDSLYPVYSWQAFAATRLARRFLNFGVWWRHRVECAR